MLGYVNIFKTKRYHHERDGLNIFLMKNFFFATNRIK